MKAGSPRIALAAVIVAATLCASLPAAAAAPAPAPARPVRSVAITAPGWVETDGTLEFDVVVTTRKSKGKVTAQIELLDDTEAPVWRASSSHRDLGSGARSFEFSKAIPELGLRPGVFTLRAWVAGSGSTLIESLAQIIVFDRSMRVLPLAVVVRVAVAPSSGAAPDAAGQETALLTAADATELAELAATRPELRLTLAVPPYLLREWGAQEQTSAPTAGARALETLRRAALAGTPMLRGMYADPDLSALASATTDLGLQADAGESAMAALGTGVVSTRPAGFAALTGPLPRSAAIVMAARGARYLVTEGTASVEPARAGAHAGAYAVTLPATRSSAGATISVLAADRAMSALLSNAPDPARLARAVFARATQTPRGQPLVLVIPVGADGVRTSAVAQSLGALATMPWVRFTDAPSVATGPGLAAATLKADPADPTPAPATLSAAVASASRRVIALLAAAGPSDLDAASALEALLLSQSRAWVGSDGSWAGAARAIALAQDASQTADSVLSRVSLDAPSVTLPGSDGKAPVSIQNSSGRNLTVELATTSDDVKIQRARTTVHLKPGENVLSVPVSLGTATKGRVRFAVTAGGFALATADATVTASYQDRIVLLAGAFLVLAGLLVYIRRRMSRAGDDDLEDEDD